MDTVADVVAYVDDVGLVVQTGFMPPWPPSDKTPEFLHDRSLTKSERDQILAWVAAGAPSDVADDTPLEDMSPAGIEVREDIRLTMTEPYVPTGDLDDDYRCFLLDPQLSDGGYVTASEIVPDERRIAHHAFLFQVSADLRQKAAEKEAEDESYGWQCYGNHELGNGDPGAIADSLSAWVPGSQPTSFRVGTGIFVEPGNLLVLQIHYNYAAGFLPNQLSVVLQVEPPAADLAPVRGVALVAPVELPCPNGIDTPQCDPDTVLNEAGPQFRFLAHSNLVRCGQTVADYANVPADDVAGICDARVPVDGQIVQVGGHMHTRGKRLRVTLNPDGANPIILQDIPTWNFDWQGAYQLAEPIPVSKGDILRIECVHDNSAETDPEKARFVYYSEGTNDEMCLTILKVEPTAEYAALSTNQIMFESLATVPAWLPTTGKMAAFIVSLIPTGVLVGVLAVVGLLVWLAVRWRRRRRRSQSVAAVH